MKELFFVLLLILNFSCSPPAATDSEPNNDNPARKPYNSNVRFQLSGEQFEAEILSVFHHSGLNNDVVEYITSNDKFGFYGYLTFPDLQIQNKKWELLGHSKTGVIYSKFTGFDPDFEVRYYGIPDSGESKITKVTSDSVYGEFFGHLKSSKSIPGFPEKIEIVKGTFQVQNKVDTVGFALGYF